MCYELAIVALMPGESSKRVALRAHVIGPSVEVRIEGDKVR